MEKLYPEACGKPNHYIWGHEFGFQKHGKAIRKRLKLIDNVVVTAISELRPGSNERYENSTIYIQWSIKIFDIHHSFVYQPFHRKNT